MQLTTVSSSNIVAIGYDSSIPILRVQFKSGTYDYYNVSQIVFEELLSASSKDKYLHAHINGFYNYSKID